MRGDQSITMVFRSDEIAAIEAMSVELDLPKVGVVRQAIRWYQLIHEGIKRDLRVAWVDADGKLVREPVHGCPNPEPQLQQLAVPLDDYDGQ